MERRSFLEKIAASGLGAMALPAWVNGQTNHTFPLSTTDPEVQPTAAQQAWMDMGFGLFIHFGINTYYDTEWSDGTLDPVKFNPTKLDTDQWCATAKAAGMKYVVLITKHHDGFCLWPTKQTKYSVSATPWKGDLVAEVVNSAEKHGLKVGFYYSLWDRHEKSHDTDEWAYIDFMKRQLEELLTGYGPIVEMWFDGFWKKQQTGWSKKNKELEGEAEKQAFNAARNQKFIEAWRMEGAYRWQMDHVYQFIKSLQPDCLVMNNSTTAYPGVPLHPVDIRSGEKYTEVAEDQKVWNWLGKDRYLPLQIETTMSTKGNKKFPSGNWFWHEWDKSVLEKKKILHYLSVAQKMEANLLLNVGPSDQGLLREVDEQTLKGLRI
ncbi:MAG: alpha-L-fucosidase [Phaeodactylibacter sp.]|uniref:alpha-L-fucosidase n=1 Tax=Phaeodactylibacter sp. TaxID=1940289 RepID=UPI0032EEF110